uniref:Kinesin motor domain-containing protein n=1 Tax=Ciona savignyi TaxID=51511 RepID=H2ZR59_CIOSA
MRLGVLESEKERVMEEKMTMSTDVTRYQQNLDASNLEIQQLKAKLQDKTTECEQLERKFHMLVEESEELRNCQKSRDENNIALSEQIAEYKIEVKSVKDFLETTQSKLDNQISIAEKLDIELREGNEERRKLLNVVQELKGNIRVFCRVRPLLKKEILDGNDNTHIETSQKSIEITNDCNKNVPYTFDRVFGDTSSQEEIFTDVALLVQSALDGYNVCIFAYGQTGAGKTYTMEGQGDGVEMGIIPRAMKLIFQKSEELLKFGWKYKLSVQHVEIYCEVLQDLLNRETGVKLDIRTAGGVKNSSVWVHGLTEHEVTNQNMVKSLLKQANQKRATAATNANERSSRSHSVFMLKISACNELTGEQHT